MCIRDRLSYGAQGDCGQQAGGHRVILFYFVCQLSSFYFNRRVSGFVENKSLEFFFFFHLEDIIWFTCFFYLVHELLWCCLHLVYFLTAFLFNKVCLPVMMLIVRTLCTAGCEILIWDSKNIENTVPSGVRRLKLRQRIEAMRSPFICSPSLELHILRQPLSPSSGPGCVYREWSSVCPSWVMQCVSIMGDPVFVHHEWYSVCPS